MQPLKPDQKKQILENRPQAAPGDLEEYERLLSARFTQDPDQKPVAAPEELREAVELPDPREMLEARIKELHQKLFGEASENENSAPAHG